MTGLSSYAEFYRSGPYKGVPQAHRQVGAVKAGMFMAHGRPAGSFSEPGVASASLQLAVAGRGTCRLDLGAGQFTGSVQPGSWVIGPAQQQCHYNLSCDLDLLILELPVELLRETSFDLEAASDFGNLHSRLSNDPLIGTLTKAIWQVEHESTSSSSLWTESALLTLAGRLMLIGSFPVARPQGGLATWQVRRATEMLAADLASDVDLKDVADGVGLSAFHFIRAFKQSVGVPPHRYRTGLRREQACRLLEPTDAPVTDIALEVGYESPQSLARVFARDLGVSATRWRRERRR